MSEDRPGVIRSAGDHVSEGDIIVEVCFLFLASVRIKTQDKCYFQFSVN